MICNLAKTELKTFGQDTLEVLITGCATKSSETMKVLGA